MTGLQGKRAGADWTHGVPAIVYQHCRACGRHWYFARRMCPHCGTEGPEAKQASGQGTVYAVTTVLRAPTDGLRAALPYTVALIDCAEGFRMLAHATAGVRIGDPVVAGFREFDGALAPFFTPAPAG